MDEMLRDMQQTAESFNVVLWEGLGEVQTKYRGGIC